MAQTITKDELLALVGKRLGVSGWLTIDQSRIDRFADVTEDHQFIHVDPERAAAGPFGTTIAHGFLTLSMLVHLCLDFIPELQGRRMLVNYGFDKVRFPAPVKVDGRIRAIADLADVSERRRGQMLVTLAVTIEIENEVKPALIAEWLSLHVIS